MLKRKKILESFNKCYCKLAPSKLVPGQVGVFAIRDIPINTFLFSDVKNDEDFFRVSDIVKYLSKKLNNSQDIHKIVSNVVRLCTQGKDNRDNAGIYLSRNVNEINMAYYVNHSLKPNVYYSKIRGYIAIRDIKAGEEISCLYDAEEIDW